MKARLLWCQRQLPYSHRTISPLYIVCAPSWRGVGVCAGLNYLPDLSPLNFTMDASFAEPGEWIMTAKISWGFFMFMWNLWFLLRTVFQLPPSPLPSLYTLPTSFDLFLGPWVIEKLSKKNTQCQFWLTWEAFRASSGVVGYLTICWFKAKFTIDTRWNLIETSCDSLREEAESHRESSSVWTTRSSAWI